MQIFFSLRGACNAMESRDITGPGGVDTLRRQMTLLWIVIVVFAFAFSGAVTWLAVTAPSAPDVVRVERLEVVEPDGSLSMVLANSQRPAVATLNRQVLMAGQEEERLGTPSITFFDGKGAEVGGLALGVREQSGSYRAMRHLALDAHNQRPGRGAHALSGSRRIDVGSQHH